MTDPLLRRDQRKKKTSVKQKFGRPQIRLTDQIHWSVNLKLWRVSTKPFGNDLI